MSRAASPQTPGVALHLIQRGAGTCLAFGGRAEYLDRLRALAADCTCTVHAYVLMGNHVHLLLTPARANAATQLVRSLGGEGRPGVQQHDDFDATPVYAARYLLACMRYIELNPVRAGIVAQPEDFRWSSYRANALGREDPLLTPHPVYYALGRTAGERQAGYRRLFARAISAAGGTGIRRGGAGS